MEKQAEGIALRLTQVRKSFGATQIIRGVDWTVRSGECHVLIGPNGAGKYTLFNLISGLHAPTHGSIMLKDTDITRRSASRINRAGLGRSFQTTNIFRHLSVFENVRIGTLRAVGFGPSCFRRLPRGGAADMRALEVLDEVGLVERCNQSAS